jgi:hypothetical protein
MEALRLAHLWRNGKLVGGDPYEVAESLLRYNDELAACLHGAVTGLELLREVEEAMFKAGSYLPGLPALIERSNAALKEYDK